MEGLVREWGPAGPLQKGHRCDCSLCEFFAGEGCSELGAGGLLPTAHTLPCANPMGTGLTFFFFTSMEVGEGKRMGVCAGCRRTN